MGRGGYNGTSSPAASALFSSLLPFLASASSGRGGYNVAMEAGRGGYN